MLPLGTGNDLANSLGWGSSIEISSDMARFKQIVQEIVDASTVNLDVWELKLSVDEVHFLLRRTEEQLFKSLDRMARRPSEKMINQIRM